MNQSRWLFVVCLIGGLTSPILGAISIGGPLAPDGKTEVTCDLPREQRIRNIGSKLDGAGMCVFSSGEMALRWGNVETYRGWRDWCAAKYPGGGYAAKVDKLLEAYAKAKNVPVPAHMQYEGKNVAEVIKAAMASGRIACITYNGHDPHYRGSIAHMVCCVAYDEKANLAAILDNNFIGDNELVWMSCAELRQRCAGNGGGWVLVFLAAPPPPVPRN